MHASALVFGHEFFKHYLPKSACSVLDVGSLDVNGTLRNKAPSNASYTGIDIEPGRSVDIVLDDPHKFPFDDESFDAVVSTSCFEHDEMFWLTFLEMARVLKKAGYIYINTPSNGVYHAYPQDCWRFYPDAGRALLKWAARNDCELDLVESFIGDRIGRDIWHDHVMVFHKGPVSPLRTDLSKRVVGERAPFWLVPR